MKCDVREEEGDNRGDCPPFLLPYMTSVRCQVVHNTVVF